MRHQPRLSLQAADVAPMSVPAKILALHAGMWADMFQKLVANEPRKVCGSGIPARVSEALGL